MYLARLTYGSEEVRFFEITDTELNFLNCAHLRDARLQPRTPHAWRFDARSRRRESALQSRGVAAIDHTKAQACARLRDELRSRQLSANDIREGLRV